MRVVRDALADDNHVIRQFQIRMEFRTAALLDTVYRPDTTEVLEVRRLRRMPVTRGVHRDAGLLRRGEVMIQCAHDGLAATYGERSAGAEVMLDIDDEECGIRQRVHDLVVWLRLALRQATTVLRRACLSQHTPG